MQFSSRDAAVRHPPHGSDRVTRAGDRPPAVLDALKKGAVEGGQLSAQALVLCDVDCDVTGRFHSLPVTTRVAQPEP